ncbi:MFS transporter [Clavibacter michiganensis]|uniref:MFS transporter n=1 Tax=Clavibacter michiganensis TaxID=28447 RepID=UPI0011B0D94E|nr:MFS transporter [Clavibacter michiganensis]
MLASVTLVSGAGQIIDFALPLFVAEALGFSAIQTGELLAAGLATASLVRPLAGAAADRWDRQSLAAFSAIVLSGAYVLLAVGDSFGTALLAVTSARVASTLLWVALRAMAAGRSSTEPRASWRMLHAEDLGSWVVLVPTVGVVSLIGYTSGVVTAAGCAVGAAAILVMVRLGGVAPPAESLPIRELGLADILSGRARTLLRAIRPVLVGVTLIGVGDGALALVLVMHLQRDLGFGPLAIACMAIPGSLAFSVASENVRRLTTRHGRRRVIVYATAAHLVCAIGLMAAREPTMIAALWALSAIGLTALLPIEQTLIASAAGTRLVGRAFGVYETVSLLGAAVGVLAAGFLFAHWPWPAVCLVCAGAMVAGGTTLAARLPVTRRPRKAPAR